VAQSYGTAREWYGKSADKGYVRAILYLGGLYEKGQGVAQNYAKAREWYEKAADRGDPTAMANLGVLYQSGFGVEQDYGKARDWYKKAANKGDARATDRLEQLRKQMAADPNQPYLGEVPAGWPIFLVISVSIFSSSPILVPMPDLTTCQQAIVEAEREFNPIAADCSPPSRAAVLPSVISIIRAPPTPKNCRWGETFVECRP
jgi:hypothetical protein